MRLIDLDPEERARLEKKPEPIAKDDPTAVCTAAGWAKAMEERGGDALSHVEPDVPNARFWRAWIPGHDGHIDIECERFNDARAFAVMVAGGREVEVSAGIPDDGSPERGDRWQVKWSGSSLDPRNPLHMVARIKKPHGGSDRFRPVRELTFS